MIKRETIRDALVGATLSLIGILPVAAWFYVKPEEPYSNVVLRHLETSNENVRIIASFQKNDVCTFQDLGVFGGNFGEWDRLTWRDLDVSQGDRLAGGQTLRIEIDISKPYQQIEVRLRHDCDGEKVDTIFITIDID